jgi:hypothetical protein
MEVDKENKLENEENNNKDNEEKSLHGRKNTWVADDYQIKTFQQKTEC